MLNFHRLRSVVGWQALDGLLDHYIPSVVPSDQQELLLRFRECHLMVLKGLAEARSLGIGWALKEITRCLRFRSLYHCVWCCGVGCCCVGCRGFASLLCGTLY